MLISIRNYVYNIALKHTIQFDNTIKYPEYVMYKILNYSYYLLF